MSSPQGCRAWPRGQQGSALLLVLGLLALVGAVSAVYGVWLRWAFGAVERYEARLRMRLAARAAVMEVVRSLMADHTPAVDGAGDAWFDRLERWITAGGGQIRVRLDDATGRINLNTAPENVLQALPGASPERVAALLDWRDADDEARPDGAERAHYLGLERPGPANRWLGGLEELVWVAGFSGSPEAWADLVDVFGPVNVNVVPPDALESLLVGAGVDPFRARSVALQVQEYREKGSRSFASLAEFVKAIGTFPREWEERLHPHLGTAAPLNVNTAPPEVLRVVLRGLGANTTNLDGALRRRDGQPFSRVSDFLALLGEPGPGELDGWLGVRSAYFRIRARTANSEQAGALRMVPVEIEAAVVRWWEERAGAWHVKVLSWNEQP